ncbi:arylsulfatase [Uliginosibacterium aquaticum]|uniref:Arylsulfatase n=1 Tax=Uliginosibacterium aquaticum TaxID=2731212 RepID=A0ABX2IH50_9RHOO|nr:arylsulfatase [Uliginosibacterium aquaticum]NSL55213.1 arylsulfatase [Uliginosibacterium aquaticum]
MKKRTSLTVIAATLATLFAASAPAQTPAKRPNIVILLGDDLGFSDTGAFGSEIKTPNIDALASDGVRFTNFYTHATSSPTRSMLLTGVDNHLNGLGNMDEYTAPNQMGVPGYEGYLSKQVATLPQLLKGAGYHTYMVGKWHLGKAPDLIPAARGFERDFTLLDGAASYWDMTNFTAVAPKSVFTEDGRYLTELPKDYYATKTYTDKLINFIDANRGDGKPFFAYVAHQAPHDPFHLPKEWRNRHVGEYDQGWDAVRQARLKRQIEMGIMPAGTQLSERMWFLPDPTVLAPAARAIQGKKMELYAGMVENLDHHIGRLVQHLKDIGEYENTIFVTFGDNGAEGTDLFKMIAGSPGSRDYLFAATAWSQTHPNAWGDPGSYVGYGPMWAQVSMTPFSQYKGWMAEGGIRNGLIVSGPPVKRAKGSINNGLMHVADIMPTMLELAGASYPEKLDGKTLPPLTGKSWSKVLANQAESPRTEQDYLGWEIFGNHAIRQGEWKIRWQHKSFGKGDWELFNVVKDPAERKDLAASNPDKLKSMLALWDRYAKDNNVILPNRTMFETLEDQLPPRVPDDAGYPPLIYKKQFLPPKDMLAEPKP